MNIKNSLKKSKNISQTKLILNIKKSKNNSITKRKCLKNSKKKKKYSAEGGAPSESESDDDADTGREIKDRLIIDFKKKSIDDDDIHTTIKRLSDVLYELQSKSEELEWKHIEDVKKYLVRLLLDKLLEGKNFKNISEINQEIEKIQKKLGTFDLDEEFIKSTLERILLNQRYFHVPASYVGQQWWEGKCKRIVREDVSTPFIENGLWPSSIYRGVKNAYGKLIEIGYGPEKECSHPKGTTLLTRYLDSSTHIEKFLLNTGIYIPKYKFNALHILLQVMLFEINEFNLKISKSVSGIYTYIFNLDLIKTKLSHILNTLSETIRNILEADYLDLQIHIEKPIVSILKLILDIGGEDIKNGEYAQIIYEESLKYIYIYVLKPLGIQNNFIKPRNMNIGELKNIMNNFLKEILSVFRAQFLLPWLILVLEKCIAYICNSNLGEQFCKPIRDLRDKIRNFSEPKQSPEIRDSSEKELTLSGLEVEITKFLEELPKMDVPEVEKLEESENKYIFLVKNYQDFTEFIQSLEQREEVGMMIPEASTSKSIRTLIQQCLDIKQDEPNFLKKLILTTNISYDKIGKLLIILFKIFEPELKQMRENLGFSIGEGGIELLYKRITGDLGKISSSIIEPLAKLFSPEGLKLGSFSYNLNNNIQRTDPRTKSVEYIDLPTSFFDSHLYSFVFDKEPWKKKFTILGDSLEDSNIQIRHPDPKNIVGNNKFKPIFGILSRSYSQEEILKSLLKLEELHKKLNESPLRINVSGFKEEQQGDKKYLKYYQGQKIRSYQILYSNREIDTEDVNAQILTVFNSQSWSNSCFFYDTSSSTSSSHQDGADAANSEPDQYESCTRSQEIQDSIVSEILKFYNQEELAKKLVSEKNSSSFPVINGSKYKLLEPPIKIEGYPYNILVKIPTETQNLPFDIDLFECILQNKESLPSTISGGALHKPQKKYKKTSGKENKSLERKNINNDKSIKMTGGNRTKNILICLVAIAFYTKFRHEKIEEDKNKFNGTSFIISVNKEKDEFVIPQKKILNLNGDLPYIKIQLGDITGEIFKQLTSDDLDEIFFYQNNKHDMYPKFFIKNSDTSPESKKYIVCTLKGKSDKTYTFEDVDNKDVIFFDMREITVLEALVILIKKSHTGSSLLHKKHSLKKRHKQSSPRKISSFKKKFTDLKNSKKHQVSKSIPAKTKRKIKPTRSLSIRRR